MASGDGQALDRYLSISKKELVVAAWSGSSLAEDGSALLVKPKMAIVDFLNGLGRSLSVGDTFGK